MAIVALGLALGSLHPAAAATTLRFAFQGDLKSLDPYSLNETFSLGVLGNVYEALTKRDSSASTRTCCVMPDRFKGF